MQKTKLFLAIFTLTVSVHAQASTQIIGGQNVSENEMIARQTVGLYFGNQNGKTSSCTGSILDSNRILTAAHCVTTAKYGFVVFSVRAGEELKSLKTAAGTARILPMTDIKTYPGYIEGDGGEYNDLAIITFKGQIPMGYQAAKFLNAANYAKVMTLGKTATLAGYGVANDDTTDMSDRGSGTLRKVNVTFKGAGKLQKNIYFTGAPGHTSCSGDSGGPALVNVSGQLYVIGVLSRGNCSELSIYTLVYRELVSTGSI